MKPLRYLVDGGATGTRVSLVDEAGTSLAHAKSGPSSLTLGIASAWEAINHALQESLTLAVRDHGLPTDLAPVQIPITAALAGTRNADQVSAFRAADPKGRKVDLMTDGHAWLIGALGAAPGTVVAVGTGVASHRLFPDGTSAMASGWGFPAGDEGGGAWIGLMAVRHLLRGLDGRAPLCRHLFDGLSANVGTSVSHIQDWLRQADATRYASLAPGVLDVALASGGTAREILKMAGHEVDLSARALDGDASAKEVCLVGGLAEPLVPYLPEGLTQRLIAPRGDAMDGLWAIASGKASRETV